VIFYITILVFNYLCKSILYLFLVMSVINSENNEVTIAYSLKNDGNLVSRLRSP
jgi:hypothetical protein